MGDDEDGAVGHGAINGLLDKMLGLSVEGGGGFVKEEDLEGAEMDRRGMG